MAIEERSMTELGFDKLIEELEERRAQLYNQRRALKNLAYDIQTFCPGEADGKRKTHDFTIVRADDCAVFGGGSVRSADFECACGATMSIQDGQSKVGGG